MTPFEEALMMLDEANRRARAHIEDAVSDHIDELIVGAVKRLEADHQALMADLYEAQRP